MCDIFENYYRIFYFRYKIVRYLFIFSIVNIFFIWWNFFGSFIKVKLYVWRV